MRLCYAWFGFALVCERRHGVFDAPERHFFDELHEAEYDMEFALLWEIAFLHQADVLPFFFF